MECKFSAGEIVIINDTAEVAFDHVGEIVVVVDTSLIGAGKPKPLEYDTMCLLTIHLDEGTILDNVPESELSSILD